MARAERPPEYFDGGFWYVVAPQAVEGGLIPAGFAGRSFCAWYTGTLVAVRSPNLVAGMPTLPSAVGTVLDALGFEAKPRARVGGR